MLRQKKATEENRYTRVLATVYRNSMGLLRIVMTEVPRVNLLAVVLLSNDKSRTLIRISDHAGAKLSTVGVETLETNCYSEMLLET